MWKLKTELLRVLDGYLVPLGFRRVSDRFYGDRYHRDQEGVRQAIYLSTIKRGDAIEAEIPYFGIRFNAVEDVFATLEDPDPLLTPADVQARSTLTIPTSSCGGFVRKTWKIRSADDIPKAADKMATLVIGNGMRAFESLSQSEHALAILSADDEQARTYTGPDDDRAKKAVALAYLLYGKQAAMQIASAKRGRLRGQYLASFTEWMYRFQSGFES